MSAERFRFDEFVVDAQGMRLLRVDAPVELEPKAFRTLLHLVRNPHRLVTKQEFLETVWPDVFVTENSLTHAIAQVRRALGDSVRAPRYIETVHVLGYRFLAEVAPDAEARFAAETGGRREETPSPSLAVLSFADMSAAQDQEHLCDGLAEELIHVLTQLSGLRVAARTSSFALKGESGDVREIGRRLGVSTVLEGSVRREGARLRVTVQLVNVADGYHLWSKCFDRTTGDHFALQDEIARTVAERLRVVLASHESWPPARRHEPHEEAYDSYLRGRYLLNRRAPQDLQRAIEHFEQAVVADPAWALPHLGIAETFEVLGLWSLLPPRQAYGRARSAAERALELDGSLPAIHLSLANVMFLHFWEWGEALRHLESARCALPVEGYGRFILAMLAIAMGRADEASRLACRHVEEEPASPIACEQAAAVLVGLGEVEHAAGLLERALKLEAGLPMSHFWLGFCRGVQGQYEEAAALLRQAADRGLPNTGLFLPAVLVRADRIEEARSSVEAMEQSAAQRYTSPVERLCGWAALGERGRCRKLFAEAERERCPDFTVLVFASGFLRLAPQWLRSWFERRRRELTAEIQLAASEASPVHTH